MGDGSRTREVTPGYMGRTVARTIGAGECAVLTSLTWSTTEIHSNREFSRKTEFGDVVLAGPVVLAVASGLFATSDFYAAFKATHHLRPIGALGVEGSYLKPFMPGDTIWLEASIDSVRQSRSRPEALILHFSAHVLNQRSHRIMTMKFQEFMTSTH